MQLSKLLCSIAIFLAIAATVAQAQAIVYVDGGSYSSMLTYGQGTSIVKVYNPTFSGSGSGITFNIGAMMSARQPVVIEICGARLTNGAIFYFLGASDVTGMKPAYIHITGATAVDSGFGLGAGLFPEYSRFIAKQLRFTINQALATYPLLSSYCPCSPTALLFGGLTLKKSTLRITTTRIDGQLRNGMFPIRYNTMTISDHSLWMIDNTYIGISFAFHGHGFLVTGYSVFIISKVNAVCDRFCISFESGINVQDNSVFLIEKSSASADGHDLLYVSGSITVGVNSFFYMNGNYFITPRYAFSVSGTASTQSGGVISFFNNNLLGLPWKFSCSGNCAAQCNFLGTAQLSTATQYQTAGLNGLTTALACNVRTSCPAPTVGCFQPLTDTSVVGTTGHCCSCKPGGFGPYCLPTEVPYIPDMCAWSMTVAKLTNTSTMTLSGQMSKTVTGGWKRALGIVSHTVTLTVTQTQTVSEAISNSRTEELTTSRYKMSHTPLATATPQPTKTKTWILSDSKTLPITKTWTINITKSISTSGTDSINASVTLNVTNTDTLGITESGTQTFSDNFTFSERITTSKTKSITFSHGYCMWDRSGLPMPQTYKNMQVMPYFPLAMTPNVPPYNFTFAIPYELAFNGYRFNLSSLGQWQVVSTEFSGETTFAWYENSTQTDSALISVGPPAERYTNIILRTATILVHFRCASTMYTETFVVVILPAQPVVQEGVVNDILASALASGIIIASPPVAAAAAWAMIFQQLMLCKSLSENSFISFTGLKIGSDDLKYLRGAIVANILIVVAQAVLVMIIGGIVTAFANKSRGVKQRFTQALAVMQWPNVMHISIGALLLLTTTASVALLTSVGKKSDDVVLALVGVGGCGIYTFGICIRLYFAHKASQGNNRTWQIAQSLGQDHFVFGNYKRPWFAGYETMNNLVIGIFAGLPPTKIICVLQLWVIFVASLIILCIIAYYRPMKTILSLLFVAAIQLLTFMAANAMLVAHYVPAQREKAFNAATLILLVIPLVALLKALTDIVAFAMHGKELFHRLFADNKQLFDFEEEEDEAEEMAAPTQEVETDDLSKFLLAIDAQSAIEKKQQTKKRAKAEKEATEKAAQPNSTVQQQGSTNTQPQEEALNEEDIFKALKI